MCSSVSFYPTHKDTKIEEMYNGIGLTTARGSATSGYVQRNLSYVKPEFFRNKIDQTTGKHERGRTVAGTANSLFSKSVVNKELLEHNRKHAIEVKVFELHEKLSEEGIMTEEEISVKCAELRERLLNQDSQIILARKGQSTDTHENSKLKDIQNQKIQGALNVDEDYQPGSAFNPEIQEQRKLKRQEEYLQRKQKREQEYVERQKAREAYEQQKAEKMKMQDLQKNQRDQELKKNRDSRERGTSYRNSSYGDDNRYKETGKNFDNRNRRRRSRSGDSRDSNERSFRDNSRDKKRSRHFRDDSEKIFINESIKTTDKDSFKDAAAASRPDVEDGEEKELIETEGQTISIPAPKRKTRFDKPVTLNSVRGDEDSSHLIPSHGEKLHQRLNEVKESENIHEKKIRSHSHSSSSSSSSSSSDSSKSGSRESSDEYRKEGRRHVKHRSSSRSSSSSSSYSSRSSSNSRDQKRRRNRNVSMSPRRKR